VVPKLGHQATYVGKSGLVSSAARVLVSRGTLVSRGSHQGNSEGRDLHELSVDLLDVLLSRSAGVNLALQRLGPSPGHGDDERAGLGAIGREKLINSSLEG